MAMMLLMMSPSLLTTAFPGSSGGEGSTLSLRAGVDPGEFEIAVNDVAWFSSGNVSVTVGGHTYSTADGSLHPNGAASSASGRDLLGSFTSTTQKWTAGSTPYITSSRLYADDNFAIFEQTFPEGAQGTNLTYGQGSSIVSSCFPSIDPRPSRGQERGYVWWGGRSFLEGSRGGKWDGGDRRNGPGVGLGDGGGPFVVFGENMSDSLVFSPASNFMVNTPGLSAHPGPVDNLVTASPSGSAPPPPPPPLSSDGSLCFGLDAPVESVPNGFSLQSMLLLGNGVNAAMKDWGTTMLKKYNTTRAADYTTQWLGFSTDNGAYYYYNWDTHYLEGISNYQSALEGVHEYSTKEGIPYKHILLDSWWYTKGNGGGLKEWDATNNTFPDGLKAFADKTGWKFQMHNRYWSDNNIYSKTNGGQYEFLTEPTPNQMAMPLDQKLWDDLIENKTKAGIPLAVYEQDWLYNEWQGLAGVRASPTLARQWLVQMGTGAAKQNTTVQYCMALSRMVLQSVEIPAVTTFRASDDYGPGQTGYYPTQKNSSLPPTDGSKGCTFPYCVYYVGTTSIIADALGLKPSKDNYWSTGLQPGSAFNHQSHPSFLNGTHEPYNEMQSAISSYTTAQVAPSDGIGFSNASLIKMACRQDGRLLQPSAPARAIDASFALSGGPTARVANVHAIMATHSLNSGIKWAHILVIGLNSSFELHPSHIATEMPPALEQQSGSEYLVWWGYQSSDSVGKRPANVTIRATPFSNSAPLQIPRCGYSDFRLYHIAPIMVESGLAFLGEVGKWVPISDSRVSSVHGTAVSISVEILGEANEPVELIFAKKGSTQPVSVLCKVGVGGMATASFDGTAARCTSSTPAQKSDDPELPKTTHDRKRSFSNVVPRVDTNGQIVNAHDGQIVKENGTYYWFAAGYDRCSEFSGLNGCAGCKGVPIGPACGCGFEANTSVNLYTSPDLQAWTAHGNVLPQSTRPPNTSLFSPRALFNDKTQLWVLWFNFVPHYSYAVATSKTPFGPFKTVDSSAGASFRWGNSSRSPSYAGTNAGIGDFSLFKDIDGTAYMLYSHDPAPLRSGVDCTKGGADPVGCGKLSVARLTPDFVHSSWDPITQTGEGSAISGFEAPAMFRRGNVYYALSSAGCCYCGQGGTVYVHTATHPLGPYVLQEKPISFGTGNITTQGQQTTVTAVGNGEFIWQGDRWQSAPDNIKAHDYQFWSKLAFSRNGEIVPMHWVDTFTLGPP